MESDHYKLNSDKPVESSNLSDATIAEMSMHRSSSTLTIPGVDPEPCALQNQTVFCFPISVLLESVKDYDSDHYKTEVINNLLKNKFVNRPNSKSGEH